MPSDAPSRVFLGLGSNVGDRAAHIEAALARLSSCAGIELVRRTALIETAPWGDEDQGAFLNAVAEVRTKMEPLELLHTLQKMERELGRTPSRRWGPREIDLDILLFGARVVDDPGLVVPHPQITERRFVLEQLLALDGSLRHPRSGRRLSSFLAEK
jgi:2-amino-4-hydroxy-6-hydroxymethyldihydropteridine diphosphokinase